MRIVRPVQTYSQELVSIECDRCKHAVTDDGSESIAEMQEFIRIEATGGYASRHWGDCTRWMVDLCEKCQHEMFGPIAHIAPN